MGAIATLPIRYPVAAQDEDTRPNRQRAQEALDRLRASIAAPGVPAKTRAALTDTNGGPSLIESDNPAATTGLAIANALTKALPWAGPGGELSADIETVHTAADGARTTTRARISFHR